ncbi:ThiF family adenylyltransferase [Massilia sp. SR12]
MVDIKVRATQIAAELERHQALADVALQEMRHDGGLIFTVQVAVPLPGRAAAAGRSSTGVLSKETCTLVFAPSWPVNGPRMFLRADFPLDLPHINPHKQGDLVSPCLVEGSIDELFHRFGMDAVIDQLVEWLAKAAAGQLIDQAQGWEPTRRDQNDGLLVFDASALNTAITNSPISAYRVNFMAREDYFHGQLNGYDEVDLGAFRYDASTIDLSGQKWSRGGTVALVARVASPAWEEMTFDEYFPDSVTDLPTLLNSAVRLGIDREALEQKVKEFCRDQDWTSRDGARDHEIYAAVILAVKRPLHLITDRERSVEFLPYFLRYYGNALQNKIEVKSVWHAYAPSAKVLQAAAGFDGVDTSKKIVLAGCGSVGSKIGMHLGRAGFGNIAFVDDDWISPHNMARHGLLVREFLVPTSKAQLMQEAFAGLSHAGCQIFKGDFTSLLADQSDFRSIGCHEADLIIDATASLTVMAAETMSPLLDATQARLARVLMYGRGRCTALLIEGMARSCRVDDLTVAIFNACRTDPTLRVAVAGNANDATRLAVGDNCSSMTTPMSDSTVSRSAALAALKIEQLLRAGPAEKGTLCIGVTDELGVGVAWREISVGPTLALSCTLGSGWTVRVPQWIADEIATEVQGWPGIETGGALIGHLVEATKTIVIGGLIDAPPDSIREAARFVLGTEGLVAALARAHEDSVGYLHFVGTWHSHPMGGSHSALDHSTLTHLADIAPDLPMLSLVWRPNGLVCAVARSK